MQIDFAFDDADLIEERTLIAIIGRRKFEGGESIIEEKVRCLFAFQGTFHHDNESCGLSW